MSNIFCLTICECAYITIFMLELAYNEDWTWTHSRTDIETCPTDYFIVKYFGPVERDVLSPTNAKMRAGKCAESCGEDILGGSNVRETRDHWKEVLSQHEPISERDKFQKAVCLEQFDDVVDSILGAFDELKLNITDTQTSYQEEIKGIKAPFDGFLDFESKDSFIELKTQWSTAMIPLACDGSIKKRKPNSLSAPRPHTLRQSSIYKFISKKNPIVVYATPFDYKIFDGQNCERMQPSYLDTSFKDIRISAFTRQNLLEESDDILDLTRKITPNFSHYVWNDIDSEVLTKIKQLWRYE